MSTQPDDGGRAFPIPNDCLTRGMTLRDWFAGQALAGLLANSGGNRSLPEQGWAEIAYITADAMLAARLPTAGKDGRSAS